jgi:hypothetical protein
MDYGQGPFMLFLTSGATDLDSGAASVPVIRFADADKFTLTTRAFAL